jgi:hypothetical protein
MPIVCDELSADVLARITAQIGALPASNPFRVDVQSGVVHVYKNDAIVVFHSSKTGFYFERAVTDSIELEILRNAITFRDYHCSAFIIDADDPTVVEKLLARFEEQYGVKKARMIEHHVTRFEGKEMMLVKFPSCVLRQLLAPTGGVMKTGFAGPFDALKQIPTLVRFNALAGIDPAESDRHMFATQYEEAQYDMVKRIHWDIVRDVIARPGLGITLSPVALWDSA